MRRVRFGTVLGFVIDVLRATDASFGTGLFAIAAKLRTLDEELGGSAVLTVADRAKSSAYVLVVLEKRPGAQVIPALREAFAGMTIASIAGPLADFVEVRLVPDAGTVAGVKFDRLSLRPTKVGWTDLGKDGDNVAQRFFKRRLGDDPRVKRVLAEHAGASMLALVDLGRALRSLDVAGLAPNPADVGAGPDGIVFAGRVSAQGVSEHRLVFSHALVERVLEW